jgi:hypothetical protein
MFFRHISEIETDLNL